MKHKALIAGIIVQAMLAGIAVAADHIGQVISVQGAAKVQGADGRVETLELQSEVYLNDRIVTEAGAKVQIMLADDAIIMVGESSEMTLDKYVYSPEVAAENETSIGLVKGIFRVITAKITDLNPKKFEVKSKLATIGIRGCELGFDVGMDRQEIHIIRVPEKKEIVVTSHVGDGKELHVFQQGVFVDVNAKSGLTDRPLTAEDIGKINRATTPSPSAVRASVPPIGVGKPTPSQALVDVTEQREAAAGNEVSDGEDLADADVEVDSDAAESSSLADAQSAVDAVVDATTSSSALITPPEAASVVQPATVAAAVSPVSEVLSPIDTTVETVVEEVVDDVVEQAQTPADPGAGEEPPAETPPTGDGRLLLAIIDLLTGDPEPTYPVIGDKVTTSRGGGADWSWGTWEQTDLLSETESRTFYGADVTGNRLSAAEFQTLAGVTSPLRTLTGTGVAGAGVTQGDQGALLMGSSDITLQIGLGVASTWTGAFDLGNASGDSLQFTSNGTLNPSSGALAFSANTYSLNAFGANHNMGSLTRNEVNGSLVGSGGGITGNIGTFDFEHGASGPAVQGVFGADLAP